MECPHCQSRKIRKDYAPPRGYALATVGLILVGLGRLVQPAILLLPDESARQRLLIAGVLVLLYGMAHLVRHGNRYCGVCGFRFREISNQPYGAGAGRDGSSSGRAAHHAQSSNAGGLSVHTPIEPILACLRFKDEAMRMDAAANLTKLTGQDFGIDADAWDAWWKENKEAYKSAHKSVKPHN